MTDFERFVEFIRREAASYNAPPETPAAAIWEGVKETLEVEGKLLENAPPTTAADHEHEEIELRAERLYNLPPETPREPMWERIEAAWVLRQSAPPAAREAGLSDLREDAPLFDVELESESPRRRSVALWMTGVAVAASILFGFAIGRGLPSFGTDAPRVATEPTQTEGSNELALNDPRGQTDGVSPDEFESLDATPEQADVAIEPLETGAEFAGASVDRSAPSPTPTALAATGSTSAGPPARTELVDRRQVVAQYATSAHLGRTETLLAAFGAGDADDAEMSDVAESARNLLGETRLLLDMPVTRSARERALLEQVELLLAQIARLGPDAPAFERQIIAEGLERLGTVASLREAAPQIGT